MTRFFWTLLRFCLSAWVGAAALFVVAGVREVTNTDFDAETKNALAAVRFPAYYLFGFVLVTISAVASAGLACVEQNGFRRQRVVLPMTVAALVIMVLDYQYIYLTLEDMMLRPTTTIPPSFTSYHQWSKYVNAVSVGLCLAAAITACAARPAWVKTSGD